MGITIIRRKKALSPASTQVQCPKCNSNNAWYAKDYQDVWLKCLCGFFKVVATKLENMVIEHVDAEDEITLPRRDSKLYRCLAALVGLREATTGELTEYLNFDRKRSERQNNGEVASQLTVLRYKGLVVVGIERKGIVGGSTWRPTDAALTLFKGVKKWH